VTGSVWVGWLFTAVLTLIAVYCLACLLTVVGGRAAAESDSSSDFAHVLMGAGMAAMFLPLGNPMPSVVWQVLFLAVAAWFCVLLVRRTVAVTVPATASPVASVGAPAHHLHHVIASLAMVYMLGLPARADAASGISMSHGDMPGMAMSHPTSPGLSLPVLTWALVAYFVAHALWSGVRLFPVGSGPAAGAVPGVSRRSAHAVLRQPGLIRVCNLTMGVGMAYMLGGML
jgi:hypothetical protein